MDVHVIAHATGTTPDSVFAVEFTDGSDSKVIHTYPTCYTKHNPLFDPFLERSPAGVIDLEKILDLYPKNTKFTASEKSKKLLGTKGEFLVKGKTKKTLLDEVPDSKKDGGNFKVIDPPVGSRLGDKNVSCPWKQSIIDTESKSIYIYDKPFSNFTVFGFTIFGYYFPTLEHFIMFLRLLSEAPLPGDNQTTKTYEFIEKTFPWKTGMMKRHVVSYLKKNKRDPVRDIKKINEKYFTYALYRKVHSHPGLLSFFLQNEGMTFYEVAPINSIWVINADFELSLKDDESYLDELRDAVENDGKDRNLFGKYLTRVSKMVAEDRLALKSGETLEDIFKRREAGFIPDFF